MRKNKGYQQDIHKTSYRTRRQSNSFAKGENKSKEQYLADNQVDACYEKIVELHELNLL